VCLWTALDCCFTPSAGLAQVSGARGGQLPLSVFVCRSSAWAGFVSWAAPSVARVRSLLCPFFVRADAGLLETAWFRRYIAFAAWLGSAWFGRHLTPVPSLAGVALSFHLCLAFF